MALGTAATIASITATTAGAGMSFYQASQQRKMQREAEAKAEQAMQEARKKLDVNFYEGLGINKEPYKLQREALLSSGAQSIQAGIESERGIAGVSGRVQAMQNLGQAEIAASMNQDVLNLNKLVAGEDKSLNQQKINLDLGTVQGAQLAAANNQELANQSIMQGFSGVTSLAGQLATQAPLYEKQFQEGSLAQANLNYNKAAQANGLAPRYYDEVGKPMPFEEALKIYGAPSETTGQGKEYYQNLVKFNWMQPNQ
jgi:hypothetical protein